MDRVHVEAWFERYLEVFSACGRDERPVADAVPFYSAPLLLTNDEARLQLSTAEDVAGFLRAHVDGMIAAGYDHSVTLEREVEVLNATTALLRGRYSRRRADDSEISAFSVAYVITTGRQDLEISVMALESSPR